ncbi:MAG: DUF1178 family protein [Polaromonas sp.]|uniref:DUF1178 family protein n=1 Tax=Polaromonas sp. TaxID=1869339 RepID=UPI002488A597|nr:DUF1178 family protein [Polaromonas sp.]MDI1238773.1 DUF1178 family protein [Polaromonas sp.]
MKVLNLQCSHQHAFEGWFASEDDFQSQLARGLVSCPLCADPAVRKMPSAPRLNLGTAAAAPAGASRELSVPAAAPAGSPSHEVMAAGGSPAVQAEFLKALRHVMANTEDVGERFADEARAMFYGDAEQRSIRGQASRAEAVELLEEGIDVMPLPLPAALKETLQ